MAKISPTAAPRNVKRTTAPSIEQLTKEVEEAMFAATAFATGEGSTLSPPSFRDFERELQERLWTVGRAPVVLFLALCEEQVTARYREGGRFEWMGRCFGRLLRSRAT